MIDVFILKKNHGIIRPGVLGNKQVYLTSSIPKISITTLSKPKPAPPCGGQPYLNESIYVYNDSTGIPFSYTFYIRSPASCIL